MFSVKENLIIPFIYRYQDHAAQAAAEGRRPDMLPCEQAMGQHCSVRFRNVVESGGVANAVKGIAEWCPKGPTHPVKALAYSTGVALGLPFAASDPCGCDIGDECGKLGDC